MSRPVSDSAALFAISRISASVGHRSHTSIAMYADANRHRECLPPECRFPRPESLRPALRARDVSHGRGELSGLIRRQPPMLAVTFFLLLAARRIPTLCDSASRLAWPVDRRSLGNLSGADRVYALAVLEGLADAGLCVSGSAGAGEARPMRACPGRPGRGRRGHGGSRHAVRTCATRAIRHWVSTFSTDIASKGFKS
jgi:hypothetical protein